MQSNPEDVDLLAIEEELCLLKNVENIHDEHAWSLDVKHHVLSLHVVINHILDSETLAILKNQIREHTHKMGIVHATFEVELSPEACLLGNCCSVFSVVCSSITVISKIC